MLSPADGRIVVVEKARDPYLERDALKISVFMNVFNVHSNRSPVDGTVVNALVSRRQLPQRGARQGVARERAQRAAPAHRVAGRTSPACRSPASSRGASSATSTPGDTLARGQRYGFIRFGSRVDVYLAAGAEPRVAVGDRSYATETILAELP